MSIDFSFYSNAHSKPQIFLNEASSINPPYVIFRDPIPMIAFIASATVSRLFSLIILFIYLINDFFGERYCLLILFRIIRSYCQYGLKPGFEPWVKKNHFIVAA